MCSGFADVGTSPLLPMVLSWLRIQAIAHLSLQSKAFAIPMSPRKRKEIAASNKRVVAIREQCDRLTDKELIKLANQYKQDLCWASPWACWSIRLFTQTLERNIYSSFWIRHSALLKLTFNRGVSDDRTSSPSPCYLSSRYFVFVRSWSHGDR